jgi:hypothetical protein
LALSAAGRLVSVIASLEAMPGQRTHDPEALMFARASILGMLAATSISLRSDGDPSFHLTSSGAVTLAVTSNEAGYGLVPEQVNGARIIAVSLGATRGEASLTLYTQGDELPEPGRYPVRSTWPDQGESGRIFHACFVAGTPGRPVGGFHGETGWVTITKVEGKRISGEFELRARGMLAADVDDENQWVTVRGSFVAEGDSTVAGIQEMSLLR